MLGIYCRTSTDPKSKDNRTIEQQKQLGIKFANLKGMSYKIYADEGKSGYKIDDENDPFKNRPELINLLYDIENKIITDVWIFEDSRLSRNNYGSNIIYYKFEKHNITLWISGRKYDLSNGVDKLTKTILDAVSEYERQLIVARTNRGLHIAIDKGRHRPGKIYGYITPVGTKQVIPNRDELKIVKEIYKMFSENNTMRDIGIKYFTNGNPEFVDMMSKVKKVHQILEHEEYIGEVLNNDGKILEKEFRNNEIKTLKELENDKYWVESFWFKEKVITREMWIETQEHLQRIKNSKKWKDENRRERNNSLGSGIVKCGICGQPFYYKNSKSAYKSDWLIYLHLQTLVRCKQRPRQIAIRRLDTIINIYVSLYLLFFDDSEKRLTDMKIMSKSKVENLEKQIKKLEKQRKEKSNIIKNVQKEIASGKYKNISQLANVISIAETDEIELIGDIEKLKQELDSEKSKIQVIDVEQKMYGNIVKALQDYFDLVNEEKFAEARVIINNITDNMILNGEELTITSVSGIQFVFNIYHSYGFVLSIIEKIINKKLKYDTNEHETANKIIGNENYRNKYLRLIKNDKIYSEYNFVAFKKLFEKVFFGKDSKFDLLKLCLFTSKIEEQYDGTYTTADVSNMLDVPRSSLRSWGYNHNVKSIICSDGVKRLFWTDDEIMAYINRPRK